MAYPIHPSQSDYDLMYSVLYDDFTAENAIRIIEELDLVVPFNPPPFVRFKVRVAYTTTEGGNLSGATTEWVWINESPSNVPTPVDSPRYEFHHWEDANGNIVDPTTVTVTGDTIFTAVFEYIPPASYNVTYLAGDNGYLTGQTVEAVTEGQTPVNIPTPVPNTQYEFDKWIDESGNTIDPSTITITRDRTFTAVFEYIPLPTYNVTYLAGNNGYLTGETVEAVTEGQTPAHIPTPMPNTQYEFDKWIDENGNTIDPSTITITRDRTFTAQFKYIQKSLKITAYSVKPRTTSTGSNGVTKDDYTLTEGEAVYEGMFTQTSSGPIFNRNGELMDRFNEVPTEDTYYQRIDNTEELSVNNRYYRKTFYAGIGGKLVHNGATVYSYTAQAYIFSGTTISTPTPQPDDGWHFDRWVDLSDGSEAIPSDNMYYTKKYAAIFVKD